MQPEMSPMVSTAVTRNIIMMDMMAWALKVGLMGIMRGMENHSAAPTLDQFTYQAALAPDSSVCGRTKPMTVAAI